MSFHKIIFVILFLIFPVLSAYSETDAGQQYEAYVDSSFTEETINKADILIQNYGGDIIWMTLRNPEQKITGIEDIKLALKNLKTGKDFVIVAGIKTENIDEFAAMLKGYGIGHIAFVEGPEATGIILKEIR